LCCGVEDNDAVKIFVLRQRRRSCGRGFYVAVKKKKLRQRLSGCGVEDNDAVKIFTLRQRRRSCGREFYVAV
jgi:hypothetical protein